MIPEIIDYHCRCGANVQLHSGVIRDHLLPGYPNEIGFRCAQSGRRPNVFAVIPSKPGMSQLRSIRFALEEIVKVIEFGKIKHPADDWKTAFSATDHDDAAFRHFLKRGNDDESKLSHRAHAALRMLYALEIEIEENRKNTNSGSEK